MNQENIGKFICKLRKENNLTQQELAKKLHVTDKAISKWENGRCMMDISFLKPLSEILGVSIIDLLNGERLEKNNNSNTLVEDTIIYANNKIKKNKIKYSIMSCIILLLIITLSLFSYKVILLTKYHTEQSENIDKFKQGLTLEKEIRLYKKTIQDDNYIIEEDFKIRNDFNDYIKEDIIETSNSKTLSYKKYNNDKIISEFSYTNIPQYIDVFSSNDVVIFSDDNTGKYFTAADRKYFLLKNDINDDVDFLKYIKKNYYIKSNIINTKREILENYSFNTFVSIVYPIVDEMILISGDYRGYIYKTKNYSEVIIIRNNRQYIFSFKGEELSNIEYIKDIISTLEIK